MSAAEDLTPLKGKGSIGEPRRLFHVAITRCKGGAAGEYPGKLIVSAFTHSENGEKTRRPARFLEETEL